jgi:hypothetical protein
LLAGLWGRIEQRLREWAAQGELLHRIEVGSAALLEIAEPQHAGAQLRKPACLRQSETTDLLGGLFFAPSSDLLPNYANGPIARWANAAPGKSVWFAWYSPEFRALAREYRSFLATVGLVGWSIVAKLAPWFTPRVPGKDRPPPSRQTKGQKTTRRVVEFFSSPYDRLGVMNRPMGQVSVGSAYVH